MESGRICLGRPPFNSCIRCGNGCPFFSSSPSTYCVTDSWMSLARVRWGVQDTAFRSRSRRSTGKVTVNRSFARRRKGVGSSVGSGRAGTGRKGSSLIRGGQDNVVLRGAAFNILCWFMALFSSIRLSDALGWRLMFDIFLFPPGAGCRFSAGSLPSWPSGYSTLPEVKLSDFRKPNLIQ